MNSRLKTILYALLLVIGALIIISYIYNMLNELKFIQLDENQTIDIASSITMPFRTNCETITTYCFEDNDCANECSMQSIFTCNHGVCTNKSLIETSSNNKCDPALGFVAFYVGDTAFGKYDYICKSADPGIAINVNGELKNKMCENGEININYLTKYPNIDDCDCGDKYKIILPPTNEVRNYISCVDKNTYTFIKGN